MSVIYAFNGDADGLCALQQLRLADPRQAQLITGVKRDIKLLDRVPADEGDEVIALDISLDTNRAGLTRLLDSGARIQYFDHHFAGEQPDHARFTSHIDTAVDVCTSILVDRYLGGAYHAWAIAAAFGDNLPKVANTMAAAAGINASARATLEKLGIYLNYNAYGESLEDLHFDPTLLAEEMLPYNDPLEFVCSSKAFAALSTGYEADMEQARQLQPVRQGAASSIVVLPDEAWARRAIGVLANELMQAHPGHAIAILSPKSRGGFTVSIRVPANSRLGADEFCRAFPTGGGRRGAAGINDLPHAEFDRFADLFETRFTAS